MPVYNHFIHNGSMTAFGRCLASGRWGRADWWAFYLVALSDTLLDEYQICAAEQEPAGCPTFVNLIKNNIFGILTLRATDWYMDGSDRGWWGLGGPPGDLFGTLLQNYKYHGISSES